MFYLFRQTIAGSGLLEGATDWHCHILPGTDDGVKNIEDSLKILEEYGRLGIREVWLTPHIMEDMPNTTAELQEKFAVLKSRYSGPVRLHLAAEYMLDGLFASRLQAGDLLPLGENGRHLLVETSYYNPPSNLKDIIGDIFSAGYFPIMAHPERYLYMLMDDYAELKKTGIKFQLNLPSLAGAYGKNVRHKAEILLRTGIYSLAGTDLHRAGQIQPLTSVKCITRKMQRLLTEDNLINL